jgi:hypothetical protein
LFTLSLLTVVACATKRESITTHQATVDLSLLQTRLYIDAKSTEEWRDKGFHSVLNEGTATARQNLD